MSSEIRGSSQPRLNKIQLNVRERATEMVPGMWANHVDQACVHNLPNMHARKVPRLVFLLQNCGPVRPTLLPPDLRGHLRAHLRGATRHGLGELQP